MNASLGNPEHELYVNIIVQDCLARDVQTKVSEVRDVIRNLVAPRFDQMTNAVLKNLSVSAIKYLTTQILSTLLEVGKSRRIFYKPGKSPSVPKSYRPISLFSTVSKGR